MPHSLLSLLKKGADINTQNNSGQTPLMYASDYTHSVSILLEHGADSNLKDNNGKTALMYHHAPEIIQSLIDAGAKLNIKDKKGKSAIWHIEQNIDASLIYVAPEQKENIKKYKKEYISVLKQIASDETMIERYKNYNN